ncbi:type II secretion system protein [Massilia glaciei]|uniref:type II secretion system protein n=1 Tax=Massilia glaciei TaxID=1524097 RepID=UPI001E5343C3|nr:type II secretion system protein [Massilia glaciei]
MANRTRTGSAMPARARRAGFTYVGLIVLVAIIGLTGAATLKINALLQRAAAEEELLDIGAAFSDALRSYAAATPAGQPPQPRTLQDLLRDPRVPGVRRHLRKVFVDPMTGKAEWGVQYLNGQSGVVALHSLSDARPFKIGNFDARFRGFDNRARISDWKFTLDGQGAVPPPPLVPPAAPMPVVPVAPQAPLPPADGGPQGRPAEAAPEPVSEPVAEPVIEPVAELVADPAADPANTPEPPAQPAQPVVDTAADPAADPATTAVPPPPKPPVPRGRKIL